LLLKKRTQSQTRYTNVRTTSTINRVKEDKITKFTNMNHIQKKQLTSSHCFEE